MDNSRIVFLINDNVRAVMAKYDENERPEMFKTFDETIKVDDLCVVQSATRFNMTVVKVTAVDVDVDFDSTAPLKWLIQKIDKPAFDTLLEQEGQAVSAAQQAERQRRKAELRESMFKNHKDTIAALALTNHEDILED